MIIGEKLEDRYSVHYNLGKGMFSSVVKAVDSTTNTEVAIKIIRNNETMYVLCRPTLKLTPTGTKQVSKKSLFSKS